MIDAPDLPPAAAIVVGVLVLLGALLTLVGALGLLRLGSFYERIHPPTLGSTLGTLCILVASSVCFSTLAGHLVIRDVLIAIFVTLTTPITLMLLARAALHRDRSEG